MITAKTLISLAPFKDTSAATVTALARRALDLHFGPGEVVFLAGSAPRGWYVIIEGSVRVLRSVGARQHVVHTDGPGGTLGEVPLFSGGTHPATGIAAEPTRCALFSRDALEDAMTADLAVAFMLLSRLGKRVRALVERLDERSSRSVQSRLAEFLLSRLPANRSSTISLGMTQLALAEELGTVREVVSRELRSLCRQGIVEAVGGGRYRLRDVARLMRAEP